MGASSIGARRPNRRQNASARATGDIILNLLLFGRGAVQTARFAGAMTHRMKVRAVLAPFPTPLLGIANTTFVELGNSNQGGQEGVSDRSHLALRRLRSALADFGGAEGVRIAITVFLPD